MNVLLLSVIVCFIHSSVLVPRIIVNAQDVSVSLVQDSAVFSNNNDEFERICYYTGSSPQFDHLEWLLNGTVFKTGMVGTMSLQVLIRPVMFVHDGRWVCRAVLSDSTVSSPVSAGILTVFNPNDITAHPQQYALADQNYILQCTSTIQSSFISWQRNAATLASGQPLTLFSVQLSDEGVYECRVSVMGASITKSVQLNVIVPPRIFSYPYFDDQPAFTNEQVILTVTFQSHQKATTTVRWFKNGIPISSTNITTRYGPAPNATTELHFEPITRENRGSYRVDIENTAEVIQTDMRTAVATFDVNVQVPPSRPAGVTITHVNDTHIQIRWNLTNQTADAGAEELTLHLQDHPNSPFHLEPNQEEWILSSEPGSMYNLTLKVTNPDGVATTDPVAVKFPATAPAVKRFRAQRVNDTTFNITLEVFYTGGGDLEQFSIRLQQNGSGTFVPLANVEPIQSQNSPRLWYAVITNSEFKNLEEPTFDINIVNAMEQSILQQVQGEVVPPGPPSILLVSRSSNSLTLQIQLSDIGTAPILMVKMNLTLGSQLINTTELSGRFTHGEVLDAILLSSLQPDTNYTFQAVAVNRLGPGSLSMKFIFTAGRPQRQITIIMITVTVAGGLILFAGMVIIPILWCGCKWKRNTKEDVPLYAEVMDKWKPKAEEGDGSQPEVSQKQLTSKGGFKELNLPTDEYEEDVPLYTEVMDKGKPKAEEGDGSQPEVTQKQLTSKGDLKELSIPTDKYEASAGANKEDHLYAVLEVKNGTENVTPPDMLGVQYSEIN